MLLATLFSATVCAQNLQLHYNHYPTLYFEYWKARDSGNAFIKYGAFLFKAEADLNGGAHNIGKFYCQVNQSFRAWKPKIFLQLGYSGGAGITEPRQYSYYITNTFQAGAEIPFRWMGAIFSSVLNYKYVAYSRPSSDPIYTLYWWKGFFHYKLEWAGDFSLWTDNRDRGDAITTGQSGKRFFFFAEPQVWVNLGKSFAVGSKVNLYYHINTTADILQVYPTIAIKVKG